MQTNQLAFQKLDSYLVAKEIAKLVHLAKIRDNELRDQATRASKSCFLQLCEGLPNEGVAMRRKYFVEAPMRAELATRASTHLGEADAPLARRVGASPNDPTNAFDLTGYNAVLLGVPNFVAHALGLDDQYSRCSAAYKVGSGVGQVAMLVDGVGAAGVGSASTLPCCSRGRAAAQPCLLPRRAREPGRPPTPPPEPEPIRSPSGTAARQRGTGARSRSSSAHRAGRPTFALPISRKCITLACVRYVWDPKKARSNEQKHGVTFEEAVTSFADPLAVIVDDRVHPERVVLIGMSWEARILLTVFIEKGADEVRLISARLATRPERRRYEEGE